MSTQIQEIFNSSVKIPLDLHTAASLGRDVETIKSICDSLKKRGFTNYFDRHNNKDWTPLMYAVHGGYSELVKFFLQNGANPNAKNKLGQTLLMIAADYCQYIIVVLLIEYGADLHERDDQMRTALFYACSYGHCSILQLLLEKGCHINDVDKNGWTCLMSASKAGYDQVVKELLKHGADPSICSRTSEIASRLAEANGHTNIKILIDAYITSKEKRHRNPTNEVENDPIGLYKLLVSLKLTKYYPIFENHGIDLNRFWTLSEKDLIQLGIKLLGPRKKIILAIDRFHNQRDIYGMFDNWTI